MGYDLRMPAAFKALQRSRPPEATDGSVAVTRLIPEGEASLPESKSPIIAYRQGSEASQHHPPDFNLSLEEGSSKTTERQEQPIHGHILDGQKTYDQTPDEQKPDEQKPDEQKPDEHTSVDSKSQKTSSQDMKKHEQKSSEDHTLEDHTSESLISESFASGSYISESHTSLQQQQRRSVRGSTNSPSSKTGPPPTKGILSRGTSGTTVPQEGNNSNGDWSCTDSGKLKFAASTPELVSNGFGGSHPHKLLAFASTASFSSGVDRYGFKKPMCAPDFDFDDWSDHYTKYMAHREAKWGALLKAHGLNPESQGGVPVRFPPESLRLRKYVRKGIPPKWRGNAWFWFARGYDKLNTHPGLYQKCVEETVGLKNSDTEHIERDLHRTFPDNIYFRNDPITNEESEHLKALRRVLSAFSVYQPKIGYCQSLNFIAGNLLLYMDEERAFWMLVIITQNYLSGLHEVNLEQVNISQGILMISVRDRLPKIWSALNLEQSFEDNFISNLPPISLCTAPWFMSLMVNVLPTETMLRVWDCFFLEGPKTLYRISMTIFKLVESQMSKATDELEVFQIIQSAPRRLYDPEVLIKACFKRTNGFGHISNEDIALLRSFVQSRRKQALDGVEQTLNDRHAYAKLHRGRRVRAKLSLYR